MKRIAGMGLGVALGFAAALSLFPAAEGASVLSAYRQLDLFGDAFERVRANYVREVEDSELVGSAIKGMVSALDPHSSYLDAKSFADMQVQTRGEYGGLGIEVTMEEGLVKVVSPIDDTPAARAGVQSGDFITHIDGEPIQGIELDQAVERMRGPANTKITLTIMRETAKKPFDVTLTRANVKIQSVRFRREGDVGYVRITAFSEQTDAGLIKALRELKKEVGPGLKGYVLDLRNNPGGLLDQAIAASDAFLDGGEVVSTRGRRAADTQRYNARPGDYTDGKPVVVLINGGSASASEIVAGALQDHRRATVLGMTSFGKGSVQTIIPLGGEHGGALRLTTAKYYTPSGRSIQATGIEPDIEVAQVSEDEEAKLPDRRSEADLPGHIAAETGKNGTKASAIRPEAGKKYENDDFQLAYALDLLSGRVASTVAAKRAEAN